MSTNQPDPAATIQSKTATREPQPRPAKAPDGKRVDHARSAKQFLNAPEHAKSHDTRVWAMRSKRDKQAHTIEEWEELRELASQIKTHTLTNLDSYLEEFEANAKANGIHVHWARDGAEHNRIVHDIFGNHGVKA